jgi:hypothetical protein
MSEQTHDIFIWGHQKRKINNQNVCLFPGDLIHLKRLYLESNSLKNLPYELGKLNIVDLGKNKNFIYLSKNIFPKV